MEVQSVVCELSPVWGTPVVMLGLIQPVSPVAVIPFSNSFRSQKRCSIAANSARAP